MKKDFNNFEEKVLMILDICLVILTTISLVITFVWHNVPIYPFLALLSMLGLIPVVISAIKVIIKKKISVDLLAVIALTFSFLAREWTSAAFITLMLAFARIFDRLTDNRAKRVIQSLMKYHVEEVHLKVGETIKTVHVREVKPGDHLLVESGERMPVDGVVIQGEADVDESSLTGESELVPKKEGDLVHTATVNESGSLVIRATKVGDDTTLSRIIRLIDESSREKNAAEMMADRFAQWYISLSLLATFIMYMCGLSPKVILSVLLVVCADDIAVAVPLAFTSAISYAARRGVIIKGSSALEQLSKLNYILTDKTGTLTRGQPKIVDVKVYGSWTTEEVMKRAIMGASESRHMVSRAILEYAKANGLNKNHTPDKLTELPGKGMIFSHDKETICFGRLSFMEQEKIEVPNLVKSDIEKEKDLGRGISLIAINGIVVGLISYIDELRPHAKEILAETRELGVREWHMLTGDNEHAAKAIATELGLRHYHSNMTPETKVDFIRKFEKERKKGEIVGYIGDGVNDAASLALVDVSIAMGGIGADAAIEAADITIMKDRLNRVPEIMRISKRTKRIMHINFGIWAVTNIVGLGLVTFGILGPAGAATYNFLTDFLPIGNALRVQGRTLD